MKTKIKTLRQHTLLISVLSFMISRIFLSLCMYKEGLKAILSLSLSEVASASDIINSNTEVDSHHADPKTSFQKVNTIGSRL